MSSSRGLEPFPVGSNLVGLVPYGYSESSDGCGIFGAKSGTSRYEGCSPRHAHSRRLWELLPSVSGKGLFCLQPRSRGDPTASGHAGVAAATTTTTALHNRQLTGRVARASPGQRSALSDRTVTEGRNHTVGTRPPGVLLPRRLAMDDASQMLVDAPPYGGWPEEDHAPRPRPPGA